MLLKILAWKGTWSGQNSPWILVEHGHKNHQMAIKVFLFSICLKQCHLPKLWRKANVIAVLKLGRRTNKANSYRLITFLCVPFKLLERIILSWINPFVEVHLPETRAGFRSSRSTSNQVLCLTSTMFPNAQENSSCAYRSNCCKWHDLSSGSMSQATSNHPRS